VLDTITSKVLIPVLVAAATAWMTVRLSLRRFRAERWWERKVDLYSRIITGLFDLRRYNEAFIRDAANHGDGNSPELNRLAEKASTAADAVEQATALGAFILSQDIAIALDALKERREQIEKQLRYDANFGEYVGSLEQENLAIDRALALIRAHARKDVAPGNL